MPDPTRDTAPSPSARPTPPDAPPPGPARGLSAGPLAAPVRLLAILVVTLTILVTGACSGGSDTTTAEPTSAATSATTPVGGTTTSSGDPTGTATATGSATPATPAVHVYDTSWDVADIQADDITLSAYGKNVDHAYETVVDLTTGYAFNPDAATPQSLPAKNLLLGPTRYMTDGCGADYENDANEVLAGKTGASEDAVEAVMAYAVGSNDPQWHLPPSGPVVTEPRIVSAKAAAAGDGGLTITLKVKATYRESYGDKPYLAPVTKTITYGLIQDARDGKAVWLVDSWTGQNKYGDTYRDKFA